jgi:hypothetical protein
MHKVSKKTYGEVRGIERKERASWERKENTDEYESIRKCSVLCEDEVTGQRKKW